MGCVQSNNMLETSTSPLIFSWASSDIDWVSYLSTIFEPLLGEDYENPKFIVKLILMFIGPDPGYKIGDRVFTRKEKKGFMRRQNLSWHEEGVLEDIRNGMFIVRFDYAGINSMEPFDIGKVPNFFKERKFNGYYEVHVKRNHIGCRSIAYTVEEGMHNHHYDTYNHGRIGFSKRRQVTTTFNPYTLEIWERCLNYGGQLQGTGNFGDQTYRKWDDYRMDYFIKGGNLQGDIWFRDKDERDECLAFMQKKDYPMLLGA